MLPSKSVVIFVAVCLLLLTVAVVAVGCCCCLLLLFVAVVAAVVCFCCCCGFSVAARCVNNDDRISPLISDCGETGCIERANARWYGTTCWSMFPLYRHRTLVDG